MLQWERVTEEQYHAFRSGLVASPFSTGLRFQFRKPVRGYLIVVNEGHVFCQCQRQVIIRAAHPENLPGLYPLSRANERSTAEDYLRKHGLNVPQSFPDGLMVFCLSTCSGDSHPAFHIQFCGDSHPAFHIQLLPYSGDSHPAALSNQHVTVSL